MPVYKVYGTVYQTTIYIIHSILTEINNCIYVIYKLILLTSIHLREIPKNVLEIIPKLSDVLKREATGLSQHQFT